MATATSTEQPAGDHEANTRVVDTETLLNAIDRLALITHPDYDGLVDQDEVRYGVIAAVEIEGEQVQLLEYAHRASIALHQAAETQDPETSHTVGATLGDIFANPELPADQREIAGSGLVTFAGHAPSKHDVVRAYSIGIRVKRDSQASEGCREYAEKVLEKGLASTDGPSGD